MLKNRGYKYYKEKLCPQIRVWLAINATVILNMLPYIIYGIIGVVIYMKNFDVTILDCMMKSNTGKNTVGAEPVGTETFVAASATVTENPRMSGEALLEKIKQEEKEIINEYFVRHAESAGEEIKATLTSVVNNDTAKIDDYTDKMTERKRDENYSEKSPARHHKGNLGETVGSKKSIKDYVLANKENHSEVVSDFKKREDNARSSWFNWNWFGIDLNNYGLGFLYKFTLMEKILFAIGIYTAFVIACTILPGMLVNMFSAFTLFVKNSTLVFGEHIKETVKPKATVGEHFVVGVQKIFTGREILSKKVAEDSTAAAAAKGAGMVGGVAGGMCVLYWCFWLLKRFR